MNTHGVTPNFGWKMRKLWGLIHLRSYYNVKTTAHFENIPAEIAKQLAAANSEIIIAVAWFTDKTLFDQLCRKAGLGVRIRLAVLNDHINTQPGRLNFGRIEEISRDSHVYLIPSGGRNAIMHHKFCVVDRSTLITGSYNWTIRAQKNDENITVIQDNPDICHQYHDVFDTLLVKYRITEVPPVDTTQVKRRLEAVRSLLQLDDWETVQSQMEHIKRATAEYRLEPLQDLLAKKSSEAAVSWIDEFLQRAGAIVLAEDMEITFLRLELRCLEIQIISLSDEKAEIERIILNFSQRSSHVLGDLLARFLKLKALKQKHTAEGDYEEQRAEEAQHEYENYKKSNEETRATPPPLALSTDETKTLKQLYREASQKVHPDKVSEADKERATELFTQLNECYQKNDTEGVRAIHAAVKNGNLFADISSSLTESEALGHKVIELRDSISKLGSTIQQIKQADSYRKVISIADMGIYFKEQTKALQQEIEKLEQELHDLGIEVPAAAG